MSHIRHDSRLLLLSLCLFQTCFGQSTTCLPLYGGDAFHPSGLFIQLVPLKQAKQNTSSTYITQASNYAQAIWDTTQGPFGIAGSTVQSAVQAEVASCVPPIPLGTPLPPQPVPFYNTKLYVASHVMAVADFNGDGYADVALVVPGSNQISLYLGNPDSSFQKPINTTVGNAATKLSAIGVASFRNNQKTDVAVVDTANNAVYVLFNKGDGTLLNPLTLPVGHSPVSLTIVDVNNDGNLDIVVTNSADGTVSVMRGNGDGTFIPASTFAVGKNPVSVIAQNMNGAQDENGNGILDLLVADNGSSDIAVLFGYGNGGFQNAQFTKTPAPPTFLASADFNNDGIPDVVALAEDANAVMMFLGGFQGKLTLTGAYLVPNLSASLSINDFNVSTYPDGTVHGDGNLDLLIPDTDRGSPVLLLGRGDGTLNAPPAYFGSNGLTSLATGDFNNDGKADLIVTGSNSTTSSLSLLLGNGNGQFQAPVNIPVPGPTGVVGVGDFNKDGLLDIAVSGNQLNILLNAGNGTFRQGAQYPNLIPSVVADFNKDGILDIAGPSNGSLGVMLGNGDGTFRTVNPVTVGSNPKTAAAADFNKDGNLDIAVLNSGTIGNPSDQGVISILLGNGTGTFSKANSVAAGVNPRALAVGDMNGDGKPDLIVATGATTASAFQVSVFLGNGDGTFQAPFNVPLPAGDTPTTMALLDVDGDGKLDVVVGDCCTDATVSYLRGNGDGTLQPPVPFYGGNDARAIAVGNWNGSGRPGLAIAYSPADNTSLSGIVPLLVNPLGSFTALTNTSGASFLPGPIAPDSIVTGFGTSLTTGTAAATGDPSSLPTTLANTSVTVKDSKGTTRSAQLYYVSPTQINYLVPAATAVGPATVAVTAPNGVTTAQVNAIASFPGMFTVNSSGLAAAGGTHVQGPFQSSFNVFYTDPLFGVQPLPINMGAKGDQIFLSLYGTGFRSRTSLNGVVVTLTPSRQTVGTYTPALYAGPQNQYPGLDQLNFQIPQSLAGAGSVTIQVTVDGVAANPVFVVIQ